MKGPTSFEPAGLVREETPMEGNLRAGGKPTRSFTICFRPDSRCGKCLVINSRIAAGRDGITAERQLFAWRHLLVFCELQSIVNAPNG